MNIKTEEEQIADRLASIIKRVNSSSLPIKSGGIHDSVVNLNYLMEDYKNKILSDDLEVKMNIHNVKSLLDLLQAHEDIVDIAYGNKLLLSYRQYKREKENEKFKMKQMMKNKS